MSLINEALKKAQRQRTDVPVAQPAPAPVGTNEAPVARIAKRRPPMPARTLVILLGGSVSLLLMGGVFIFIFFLHGLDSAPEPQPTSVAVRTSSPVVSPPPPAVSAPSSVLSPPSSVVSSPPAPAVQLPPIAVPVPPPAPVVSPPPSVSVSPPVAVVSPQSSVLSPPPSTPTANSRVYEFLEKLRVSGIRASDTDPKVIMNDRVYRLNDIVDRTTQLRLTRIESSTLTFVDASGFEYRKNF